jgi:hypothetical protein
VSYKPTGKPPGRPRSDGKPAGSPSQVRRLEAVGVTEILDYSGGLCRECFPNGWAPKDAEHAWCEHGTYDHKVTD